MVDTAASCARSAMANEPDCEYADEIIDEIKILWKGMCDTGESPKMLTHCGRDKMAAISQTESSNAFYSVKILNFKWYFTEMCSKGSVNNESELVQIMACRRSGDKP